MARLCRTTTSATRPPGPTMRRGDSSRCRFARLPSCPLTDSPPSVMGGSGAERAEHRPGDDVPLDLAGAVPDPLHARIAPEPLDRQLVHQPHAAVDLDGLVGD